MKKVEIKTNPERLKSLTVGDKVFRSAYDYSLSPEDEEQARRELNETEEVRKSSLLTLKEMLSRDRLKFNYRLDEENLLRFLRCKKFNCDNAYKMMHYFYDLSKDYPDTFAKMPADYQHLLNNRFISFLPYRDEDGSIIFIERIGVFDPRKESIYDIFQYIQPITDIITTNPSCQINKIVAIIDCTGFDARILATGLNPITLRFWTSTCQNAYTWRFKLIIFVNANKLIRMGLGAIRYLMKKKIADRIQVFDSDMTKLHQYLDPAILPKEYGGNLDYNECSITEHIMENLPYVEYEQSFRNPKRL